MLQAGRRLEAVEKIELCDIAAIPSCNGKYMNEVRSRYESFLRKDAAAKQSKSEAPKMQLSGQEARDFMFSIFAMKKRLKS